MEKSIKTQMQSYNEVKVLETGGKDKHMVEADAADSDKKNDSSGKADNAEKRSDTIAVAALMIAMLGTAIDYLFRMYELITAGENMVGAVVISGIGIFMVVADIVLVVAMIHNAFRQPGGKEKK